VSNGAAEAEAFLNEVNIDAKELHEKMEKAFPGTLQPLPTVSGKRVSITRRDDVEQYFYKLCSKLIHPSALMLNHPDATIKSEEYKEQLAVEVLFYAWWLVSRFHNLVWHD
jgi:hypothetical protein